MGQLDPAGSCRLLRLRAVGTAVTVSRDSLSNAVTTAVFCVQVCNS